MMRFAWAKSFHLKWTTTHQAAWFVHPLFDLFIDLESSWQKRHLSNPNIIEVKRREYNKEKWSKATWMSGNARANGWLGLKRLETGNGCTPVSWFPFLFLCLFGCLLQYSPSQWSLNNPIKPRSSNSKTFLDSQYLANYLDELMAKGKNWPNTQTPNEIGTWALFTFLNRRLSPSRIFFRRC